MKFEKFMEEHPTITIKNVRVDKNPYQSKDDGDHWKTTIKFNNKQFTIPFTMGFGYRGAEPTIKLVLDAMCSDANSFINYDFEEFIEEYGHNCKEGKKIYKACEKSKEQLERVFGDLFETLMYEVEF